MAVQAIQYSNGFVMYIADKSIPHVDVLADIARNDTSHPLHKNYQRWDLSRFIFFNIIVFNDVPVMFWGTEKPKWCPPNIARAYTRFYKNPIYRTNETWQQQAVWTFHALNYANYSNWLEQNKIDNILYTRNVTTKRDAVRLLQRSAGWKKYPHVCVINQTPQHVYYWKDNTDLSFLKSLHQ